MIHFVGTPFVVSVFVVSCLLVYYYTLNTLLIYFAGASCVFFWLGISSYKLPHNQNVPILMFVLFLISILESHFCYLLGWNFSCKKGTIITIILYLEVLDLTY